MLVMNIMLKKAGAFISVGHGERINLIKVSFVTVNLYKGWLLALTANVRVGLETQRVTKVAQLKRKLEQKLGPGPKAWSSR